MLLSSMLYSYRKISKGFLVTLVFSSLILIIVALFPDFTFVLSKILGVSRGADAVVYLAILFLFLMLVRTNIKIMELELKLTKLVRNLAIENAKFPKKNKKRSK